MSINLDDYTEIELATLLAEKLCNNEDYVKYTTARDLIMTNETYVNNIKSFRKAEINYQQKILNGQTPSFDEEKAISSMYTNLTTNEITSNFMVHEKRVLDLLNSIYQIIGDSVSFKIDID